MHVKLIYHFDATSLLLTFVNYTTSHNTYYYSEKHRHTYWVMGTPLSLVGYWSNLQKPLVVLTNEGIWKKIDGDRPLRLTCVIEHSGHFSFIWHLGQLFILCGGKFISVIAKRYFFTTFHHCLGFKSEKITNSIKSILPR